jgi:hypothetical protein
LERLFRENPEIRQSGMNIEVINFGIGKTGTSHQLALYEKEGKKYQLDVVMLGFLSVNDFIDNWNGVYYLQNDSLIHNAAAYSSIRKIQGVLNHIPFYKWASTHSHLVNLVKKAATIYDDKNRAKKNSSLSAGNQVLDIPEIEHKKLDLTLRLIERFRTEANENGSSFLVVNLPDKDHKAILNTGVEKPSYLVSCDSLNTHLRAEGFEVLDMFPVFMKLPTEPYYFAQDGHMNPKGQAVLAAGIYHDELPDIMKLISAIKIKNQ